MNLMKPSCALLVMDMQSAVIRGLTDYNVIIDKVGKAIVHARVNNIPVIYVVVDFRPGMPEISLHNKMFAGTKERSANMNVNFKEIMQIDPSIAPLTGDIVVHKRRLSAFTGSDLEIVLRSQSIQQLVLTGVSTSGVVLSTLREAADKDYIISVISDCCSDAERDIHHMLTTKIFPNQAEVVNLEEWKMGISKS